MDLQLGLMSVILGIGLHVVLFRHGEWHLFAYKFKLFHILAILLLMVLGVHLAKPGNGWAQDVRSASWLVAGIVSGVWSSMLVYRAFFHRLTRHGFSGPFVARLSQFYQTTLAAKNLRICDEIEVLHKRYGDIVRIGPQELSIADPRAMVAIHGTNTKPTVCTKAAWYDMVNPKVTLQAERDRQMYSQRGKLWDQAFSSKGEESNFHV